MTVLPRNGGYMDRQVQVSLLIGRFRKLLAMIPLSAALVLFFLITTPVFIPIVQARAPDWNYSSPDSVIGGVAVSSKGDLIAAAAEKVLFFTRNGTLLGKEPFGNTLVMTPDGKYTASEYFSTLYFYKNPLPAGTADQTEGHKSMGIRIAAKDRVHSASAMTGIRWLPRPWGMMSLSSPPKRLFRKEIMTKLIRWSE